MTEQRRPGRYPAELRERTVRMVIEAAPHCGSEWEAICRVAEKVGPTPETVRKWMRRHEIDSGERPGLTTDERERMRELEREAGLWLPVTRWQRDTDSGDRGYEREELQADVREEPSIPVPPRDPSGAPRVELGDARAGVWGKHEECVVYGAVAGAAGIVTMRSSAQARRGTNGRFWRHRSGPTPRRAEAG